MVQVMQSYRYSYVRRLLTKYAAFRILVLAAYDREDLDYMIRNLLDGYENCGLQAIEACEKYIYLGV